MAQREIEGEWIMGWPDRRRPQPLPRKDDQGRVAYQRSPWAELEGLITPTDLRYIVAQLQMPDPVHPNDWSLTVGGEVEQPLRLTLDDVRTFPARTVRCVHECSGTDADFFDYLADGGERPEQFDLTRPHTGQTSAGEFRGVPLRVILEEAGLRTDTGVVLARGFDHGTPGEFAQGGATEVPEDIHYVKGLPLEKAMDDDTILAWALNGEYLRHVHGAPLRLIVPGWSGNWSVKWLESLDVVEHAPHLYYQDEYFYYARSRDDVGREPITTMGVRCVILDPRHGERLERGVQTLRGLAWSGAGRIERVEVSTDGGVTWDDAVIEEPRERWLWARWLFRWHAEARGTHTLMARATDGAGRVQPQTPWNFLRKNFDGIVPVDVTVA